MIVNAEKDIGVVDDNDRRGSTTIPLKQQHFVLVHGMSGGGWCWYKIRCLMENSGYKVILVGHSAGGMSVTQACHKFANKIRVAVYLAATMLKLGFWNDDDLKIGVPDFSKFGDVFELGFGLGHHNPPTSALVKKEFQREIFSHLSPHEDCTLAAMLLRPGPMVALTSAKFRDDGEVEKVPRVFIKTKHDKVVTPEQQEAMIKRWSPCTVYELDSDHSPFFSTPFLLFGLLVKLAASDVGCTR
ncbi:hypothetical protein TanjilG_09576 [Lupinus angustifolius]|uniref:AB hydrolase-1 domain-containing protein n=1 Tax=Lupinus angustifolius TaxID=3871 RepID=A0A394DB54_LUPAN|nr:hypothetical protein TanjilG_09576 [Lupinus angustifolius]